ncbi:nickel-dependent hydrogenase large subunit [Corynebacterium diphtheriae]|nr:nickel-dependent hydrogenase large subunit [Corynebacterium diphtheriae]
MLSAYIQGHAHTRKLVDDALRSVDMQVKDLNSTAGRTLARAIEAITTADHMAVDLLPAFVQGIVGGDYEVFDSSKWEPDTWPKEASDGFGLMEVARGCLGHYVTIEDQKVTRYQAVVPTTWLAGGRDPQGNMGPYEESLAGGGHPLLDPKQPLEPLRTIHSFDPCMSCAVHVLDVEGHEEFQVMTS